MRCFVSLFFIFIAISARCQVKIINDFRRLINEPKNLDGQLLWDGYYNNLTLFSSCKYKANRYSPDTPASVQSIIFFKNGLLTIGTCMLTTEQLIKIIADPKKLEKRCNYLRWGTYDIINDTINAIIFINYGEGSSFLVSNFEATHYMGIIKNKGEIVHWRAVPPYPKIETKFGQIDATENSTLVFHRLPEKTLIDSTKAWVNQYRK